MTFNSVSFFAFFPLAVLVCWLVPRRWQNAALLAVSYAFYCFNTPAWLPVLVLDSLATWALVRRMDAAEGLSRKRRLWAALGVNLGLLVLLKGRLSAAPRRGRQRRALAGIVPSGPRQ